MVIAVSSQTPGTDTNTQRDLKESGPGQAQRALLRVRVNASHSFCCSSVGHELGVGIVTKPTPDLPNAHTL